MSMSACKVQKFVYYASIMLDAFANHVFHVIFKLHTRALCLSIQIDLLYTYEPLLGP